jgi:hypothetical protein
VEGAPPGTFLGRDRPLQARRVARAPEGSQENDLVDHYDRALGYLGVALQ